MGLSYSLPAMTECIADLKWVIVSNDSSLQVMVSVSLEATVSPTLKQIENFMVYIYILPA